MNSAISFSDPNQAGPVFFARYPGECSCGAEFDDGDLVQYVDGELVAVDCCGEGES